MVKYRRLHDMAEEEFRSSSRLSILSRHSSNADCHSQFSEEEFQRDLHQRPNVVGPAGIPLPRPHELKVMLKGGEASVMCFTWNIASKPANGLYSLSELFRKLEPTNRPDIIVIALQELPASTIRFHNDMVNIVERGVEDTHRVYCWVRKWSQMVLIFVKKKLSLYLSYPEYQFVATRKLASPFRTKGAIGICFRLLQTTCVFVACHLTHGKVSKRVSDYRKLSNAFNFKLLNSGKQAEIPMKKAANVFWFGDLNFRVSGVNAIDELRRQLQDKLFRQRHDFANIVEHDELNREKENGLVFHGFREGKIMFPPTHKFIKDSNQYARNRVPSYTDRVLYWSTDEDALRPIRYDSIWNLTVSDHKPVYCTFKMRVLEKRLDGSVDTSATSTLDSTDSRTTSAL